MSFISLTGALLWGALFSSTIGGASSACSGVEESVCLIVLDTASSPLSRSVRRELEQMDSCHVRLMIEANPAKAIECAADERIERIAVIAHSAQAAVRSNGNAIYLTWPRRLAGDELVKARTSQIELINRELSRIGERASWISQEGASSDNFDVIRLQQLLRDLRSNNPTPIYAWGLVYDQFFTRFAETIRLRKRPMLSFHLAACEPSDLRLRYPSLEKLGREVPLELAPPSNFASFFYGGQKVTIDSVWLRTAIGK